MALRSKINIALLSPAQTCLPALTKIRPAAITFSKQVFKNTLVCVANKSRHTLVAARSRDKDGVDDDDSSHEEVDDEVHGSLFDIPLGFENSVHYEIVQRLKLVDYLNKRELYTHLAKLGDDTVWELRISFGDEHQHGQFPLKFTTIHGLWKSHIKNGQVVSDLDRDEYRNMRPLANKLSVKIQEIPNLLPRLEKVWKCLHHTRSIQSFMAHEMAKHGFLSLWYFVIAIEAVSPYFDENGDSNLMKLMKEMGYVEGKFNCLKFQTDMSKRLGYKILTTYKQKKEKGKLYPWEFGILFASNFKRIDYLYGNGEGKGIGPTANDEFYLDKDETI